MEFLEQVPELDAILVPVSGGGMISGIAIAAKAIKPNIKGRPMNYTLLFLFRLCHETQVEQMNSRKTVKVCI